jgi:hypothetical protein
VIRNFCKNSSIPPYVRSADFYSLLNKKPGVLRHPDNNKFLYSLTAGAKLQAEKAIGFFSTALGRLGFGHLHALTACFLSEGF